MGKDKHQRGLWKVTEGRSLTLLAASCNCLEVRDGFQEPGRLPEHLLPCCFYF